MYKLVTAQEHVVVDYCSAAYQHTHWRENKSACKQHTRGVESSGVVEKVCLCADEDGESATAEQCGGTQ